MKWVFSLVFGLLLAVSAQAQIILTVDVSNPSAVKFTATGIASTKNDSSLNSESGFTLQNFLNAVSNYNSNTVSGDLTALGMSIGYNSFFAMSYSSGSLSPGIDFNLFSTIAEAQNFSTVSPAFSGSATVSLFLISSILPAEGHTGSIRLGDGQATGPMIGEYLVVPEPTSLALITLAGGALLFLRRRGRSAPGKVGSAKGLRAMTMARKSGIATDLSMDRPARVCNLIRDMEMIGPTP